MIAIDEVEGLTMRPVVERLMGGLKPCRLAETSLAPDKPPGEIDPWNCQAR